MVPSYLANKCIRTSSVHEHNLRGEDHNFLVPRPLSKSRKKSFSYRDEILWNNMPVQISSAQSLSEFMSLIRKFIYYMYIFL
jgi:hypothetical protein